LKPYGQPLGVSDLAGKLVTRELAIVPSVIEIQALRADGTRIGSGTFQIVPNEWDRTEAVAPGIVLRERRWVRDGDGPFTMRTLEIDSANPAINLLPVRAHDHAVGVETVSSMAARYGATAAINAGYFITTGTYRGGSEGVYQFDREVISGGAGKSALLMCEETDFRERVAVTVVNFKGSVATAGGGTFRIAGVNRRVGPDELVVFRPTIGARTLTDGRGVEVVADSAGRVLSVHENEEGASIPADGVVLSGTGRAAAWLLAHAKAGASLKIDLALATANPLPGCNVLDMIGGGPQLVSEGRVHLTKEWLHEKERHPRTAFAITSRGKFLLVTLDGRQPGSAGMRVDELAEELLKLGAVEAINLDGGGSTTLVTKNHVRNLPSDRAGERPVSDAILVFSISDKPQLDALVETLAKSPTHISPAALEALHRGVIPATGLSIQARRLITEAAATIK
jgi:hypothetical protein